MRPKALAALMALTIFGLAAWRGAVAADTVAVANGAERLRVDDQAELSRLFADRTFYGRYSDGSNFVEYYAPDGRLAYWDGCPHTGRWWIEAATACFEYPTLAGGSTFCFDVYHAPLDRGRQLEFLAPGSAPDWIATAFTRMIAPGNPENLSLTASGCQVSQYRPPAPPPQNQHREGTP